MCQRNNHYLSSSKEFGHHVKSNRKFHYALNTYSKYN